MKPLIQSFIKQQINFPYSQALWGLKGYPYDLGVWGHRNSQRSYRKMIGSQGTQFRVQLHGRKEKRGLSKIYGRKDYGKEHQASFSKSHPALTFEHSSLQCCGPRAGNWDCSTGINTHMHPTTPISDMWLAQTFKPCFSTYSIYQWSREKMQVIHLDPSISLDKGHCFTTQCCTKWRRKLKRK